MSPPGYGYFYLTGRPHRAHRVAWYIAHGTMPTANVLHRCDVRACCNHAHLFEGTQQRNLEDMRQKHREGHGGAVGVRNTNAKLTDDLVLEMRDLARCGVSTLSLARQFSVAHSTAKRVVTRRMWRHVK